MAHTHSHPHSHTDHHHGPASYNRAFAVAVLLNLLFVFIEAFYALSADSMSLLADAGHNLADVLGLLLAWAANWLHGKDPSERYSYGHKKTSIVAALINALLLVGTSAIIAYESIHKIVSPTDVQEVVVMVVAFIGILVNTSTALLFLRGRKDDLNIQGAFLHLAYDALISLGVVLTAGLIYLTKWNVVDGLVGLAIAITILLGSWGLLRDSVCMVLDAVPHGLDQAAIRQYFSGLEGVETVHDLHIWGLSTREIALTVHLIMPGKQLSDKDYVHIDKTLHEKFNVDHVTIQVEQGHVDYLCKRIERCF